MWKGDVKGLIVSANLGWGFCSRWQFFGENFEFGECKNNILVAAVSLAILFEVFQNTTWKFSLGNL